jgi:amino-acid N-acetyltransferase
VTITIQSLDRTAMPDARSLLTTSDLPTDDIDDPAIALFGAFAGDTLVGVIGLQSSDGVGLLRSLAVAPEYRDRGIARLLCERVIEAARDMPSLWLLTTTAKDYFLRHAFEVVPRTEAPEALRATAQFSSLCPSTAHVMRRR